MFSKDQFDRTRRLALSLAGLQLTERHHDLLNRRSGRLGISDGASLDLLLRGAEEGEVKACQDLVGLLTTKVTGFFRHPAHFVLVSEHAWRMAREYGQARLWSSAAATGEEPYSMAMGLIEKFDCPEPPVSILATEIDAHALEVAQRGEYRATAVQALSPVRRARFLLEDKATGCWTVRPEVRRLVDFQTLNLTCVAWPFEHTFDVVLCRNVLMYMDADHRYAVLEHMAALLRPEGLLFLDPAECLGRAAHLFAERANGVFSPKRAGR